MKIPRKVKNSTYHLSNNIYKTGPWHTNTFDVEGTYENGKVVKYTYLSDIQTFIAIYVNDTKTQSARNQENVCTITVYNNWRIKKNQWSKKSGPKDLCNILKSKIM